MIDLKLIVTGTGRCGTVYMARLLTSLGIPCSHEGIFTPFGWREAQKRMNSGKIATSVVSTFKTERWLAKTPVADSSYMAAPFLSRLPCKTIHLVRNPLKVLSSFYYKVGLFSDKIPAQQQNYHRFVNHHMPNLKNLNSELERTVTFIVEWNRLIERNAQFRHKIEDKFTKSLADFLEVEYTDNYFNDERTNNWENTPFPIGGREYKELTLEDIPAEFRDQIKLQMEEYGYA